MNTVDMVVNAFSSVPQSQRLREIFVFIERSCDLLFWEKKIFDFILGLRKTGIFCSVQVLGLSVSGEPFLLDSTGQIVPIASLCSRSDRDVFVCILTTGVDYGWQDGRIARFFMPCVASCFVVIGQMFSPSYWKSTSIGESSIHFVRNEESGELTFNHCSWWEEDYVPVSTERPHEWHLVSKYAFDGHSKQSVLFVPIPIFDINDEEIFSCWVDCLFSCRGEACGVMLNLSPVTEPMPCLASESREAQEIVNDFYFIASKRAFRIAVLLSAIVGEFTPSVLFSLVNIDPSQEFSETSPAEACAEVLFGGFLRWVNRDDFDTCEPRFVFRDDNVRFAFSRNLLLADFLRVKALLGQRFPHVVCCR
ncbi:MAG: hypothetical protein RIQ54_58 [Candidatus Parcubacteria bacterium]|jgi:hypothetical protein